MHLWRGFRVSDASVTTTQLNYKSKNNKFEMGFWAGYSLNGFYTEFDNYLQYSSNGFTVAIWDINNFTNYETNYYNTNSNFFDYNRRSSRFVDVTLAYQLKTNSFPISISWSTIVLGRDYFINESGKDKGRYSSYIEISSPIYKDNSDGVLGIGFAGAFALSNLNGNNDHFYGSKPNLVNTYLTYTKPISFLKYQIPFSVMAMYNPELKIGSMALSLVLF